MASPALSRGDGNFSKSTGFVHHSAAQDDVCIIQDESVLEDCVCPGSPLVPSLD